MLRQSIVMIQSSAICSNGTVLLTVYHCRIAKETTETQRAY